MRVAPTGALKVCGGRADVGIGPYGMVFGGVDLFLRKGVAFWVGCGILAVVILV